MSQGKLIVIDGGDGAGKQTQTEMLVHRLVQEGRQAGTLDFPRYTQNTFGQLIRECLDGKRGNFLDVDPRIASVLFAADRYESKSQIEDWLKEGRIVILDRYVSANMLHQGSKISDEQELTEFLNWLDHMEHEIFKLPRPDMIIYLDVDPEERMKLLRHAVDKRENAIDLAESSLEHQKRTTECARKIVEKLNNWKRIECMNGGVMRSREEIHEELYDLLTHYL